MQTPASEETGARDRLSRQIGNAKDSATTTSVHQILKAHFDHAVKLLEQKAAAQMAARDDRRTLSSFIEKTLAEVLAAQSYLQAVKQQELPIPAPGGRRV
jgi:hypothetical protein